jgi:hypothetical protein
VPIFSMTVRARRIAYIEFSGPREGELPRGGRGALHPRRRRRSGMRLQREGVFPH